MKVTLEERVEDPIASQYWGLYEQAFADLKTMSPCRQYLREAEFHEEMVDQRIIKFILWDEFGAPVSMALVANDLYAVHWISPEFFAVHEELAEDYRLERIYYFGALLTAPHARRMGNMDRMLAEAVNFVVSNDGVAAFDVAHFNVGLPLTIRLATEKQAEVKVIELGTQHYYAYKAMGFKPGFGPGVLEREHRSRATDSS